MRGLGCCHALDDILHDARRVLLDHGVRWKGGQKRSISGYSRFGFDRTLRASHRQESPISASVRAPTFGLARPEVTYSWGDRLFPRARGLVLTDSGLNSRVACGPTLAGRARSGPIVHLGRNAGVYCCPDVHGPRPYPGVRLRPKAAAHRKFRQARRDRHPLIFARYPARARHAGPATDTSLASRPRIGVIHDGKKPEFRLHVLMMAGEVQRSTWWMAGHGHSLVILGRVAGC